MDYFFFYRYATVQRTLIKDNTVFTFEDGNENQQMFGLTLTDLSVIKPNYEAMVKGGALRITDDGYAQGIFPILYKSINFFLMENRKIKMRIFASNQSRLLTLKIKSKSTTRK